VNRKFVSNLLMAHQHIVGHLVPHRYYKLTRCKSVYIDAGVIRAKI